MLIALSTLLAKGRRAHQPVFICDTGTIEIAQAVLQVAEKENRGIALQIDSTSIQTLPIATLLDIYTHLAEPLSVPVSIILHLNPSLANLGFINHPGLTTIGFKWGSESIVQRKDLVRQVVIVARQSSKEVIGELTQSLTPLKISTFVQETGIHSLTLGITQSPTHKDSSFSLAYLRDLSSAAKVPLISPEVFYTPAQLRHAHEAGLQGFVLKEYLQEAYTAGIRTGLHSHSVINPSHYQLRGMKAVEHSLAQLLNHY